MSVVVVVLSWLRLYSPAVGVICDGRQSSAKRRRRSHSRCVAPEYTCSGGDDKHCGMYLMKGKEMFKNVRVRGPLVAKADQGKRGFRVLEARTSKETKEWFDD
jgi:hypothetical protein